MEVSQETKSSGYGKRPMWQWIALYAAVGLVVYGLVYYFLIAKKGGYNATQTGLYQTPTTTQPAATPTPAPAAMTAQEITDQGDEFKFTPATLTVKKGQRVRLTFKNTGQYPHNFTVSDLNVQTKTIKSGEQDMVEFTPDKTGQFSSTCTVDSHADKGMKGTISVQ